MTGDPSFWKDQGHAKEINRKLSDISYKISTINDFHKRLASIKESLDFLKEEMDADIFADADSSLISLHKDFDAFEKEIFYAGKYDNCNAIVEFHPGAGGTEAHDWASMLLRMYERYAEKHGFKYKVVDILGGEEGGISSATLEI